MSFITPYQREKEYKKRAEERLKDHQFTLLVDTEEVQIYRCRDKSGSVVYGFDIILAPNCITVSGDIGRVLYGVGRGLGFLANYGCSNYGFEKLDRAYYERKEVSDYLVADYFYRAIYEQLGLEELEDNNPPKDLKTPSDVKPSELYAALRELKRTLQTYNNANSWEELPEWLQGISLDDSPYYFKELLNELAQCSYKPSSEEELFRLMSENDISEKIDWPEDDFTVHHSSVMWVTACAEYAAGRILEQQKEAV
ncbi:hypothetical protein H0A36_25305 [Endozoicomonas sp. SM1973]|uniref:Uncharacterized protein n=1 Tax=Spartinivicinus marinus TaxID=2994442 RepID=A0A853I600_9GAMM|nr:hypothetical protein [Spartinivicinus marinus]NYZ69340.1 hypothetical protein [Spartinivicinus marinus]